jgi:hypothetical protein
MPQIFPGERVDGGERPARFPEKNQSRRSRQHTRIVRFYRPDGWRLPRDFSGFHINRTENFHRRMGGIFYTPVPAVVCLAIDAAIFHRHDVVEPRRGIVRRGIPVRRAADRRTGFCPERGRLIRRQQHRPSVRSNATRPRQLLNERRGLQQFPVRTVQNIKKAVAIGVQQQLSFLAMKSPVDEHQGLVRVPVVKIVRSELEMPDQLTGLGVERQIAVRIKVVAAAIIPIRVGVRVADSPVKHSRFDIVTAGRPRRATEWVRAGLPRF